MKLTHQLILLLFLAIWGGCTSQEEAPNPEPKLEYKEVKITAPRYMTRQEVQRELQAMKTRKAVMDEPLTPEEKAREANLIPDKDFINLEKSSALVKGVPKKSEKADPNLPAQVDYRFRDTPIKHQDNGKCTAFSGVAGMENLLNAQNGKSIPHLDLSEWHAWSLYHQYSSDAFVKALSSAGGAIGDESLYPQYGKPQDPLRPYVRLGSTRFIGDDENEAVKELVRGGVVYLAMKTPKEMLKCHPVISPSTAAAGGGHAILMVGYYMDGGKVIGIIKNSWGADCGDHGYQYLPLSVCHKRGFYCSMWAFSSVVSSGGAIPGEVKPDQPTPKPIPQACHRLWYAPWKKVCD